MKGGALDKETFKPSEAASGRAGATGSSKGRNRMLSSQRNRSATISIALGIALIGIALAIVFVLSGWAFAGQT